MSKKWNFKWFGFWKEYGEGYHFCPSIRTFIDRDKASLSDFDKISNYLKNSTVVMSTGGLSFRDPITGKELEGSVSIMTDGEWLWLDKLADQIELYNVVLPLEFLEYIEKRSYIPNASWGGDPDKLPWPNPNQLV